MSTRKSRTQEAPAPLASIDLAVLDRVIGGAGDAMSAMLPMMMMMRSRGGQAAAAPAPAPAAPSWTPKILVDGVQQQVTDKGNGTFTTPDVSVDG